MQKLLSIFVYLILLIFLESAAEVTGVPASAPAELPEEPNYVAITFDDGFYSTTKFALPVLKRYGFTGSVFVIGSAIDEHHGLYHPEIRQHASHEDMQDERVLQYYSHSYDHHHKDGDGFRINQLNYEQLRWDRKAGLYHLLCISVW